MTSAPDPPPLIGHFRRLAAYNAAANRVLYDACAALDDAELRRPRAAVFGSILGTLNHILLGDRIWLDRFDGRTVPSTGLDTILHEEVEALAAARTTEDARIIAFADRLTPAWLAGRLRYVNNSGRTCDDPTVVLVAHMFNHQTHHRGQVHGLLCQTDRRPPSLDLHRLLAP